MAFSSRRGGGGWVHSLLPSTAAKSTSKQTRSSLKPRRRTTTAFRDFILSNFFTIGILFSLFLFLFLLFRFGVPRPHQFRAARSRFPRSRKPVIHKAVNDTVLTAAVDITTKELYDKIQFLDEDGGPWKQGWKVTYKGSEWNNEKLKVFVVPHSHNDPGWKLTVEEYYDRQSRHILDTIVETLSKVIFLVGIYFKLISLIRVFTFRCDRVLIYEFDFFLLTVGYFMIDLNFFEYWGNLTYRASVVVLPSGLTM
ncbi:alpha-mannosidase 2 [Olea europaea subsp. europaea]|uniref:Alpha-mannosidase 2 n=1 Tax=Olea europaea subsp. europaea TaxID=158383 RepID=A0A8S0TIF9_OLEEU|nr:alpha-mannosidase 2 [Olea europaea subsp. europaea]